MAAPSSGAVRYELYSKNVRSCIENVGFCTKNDGFASAIGNPELSSHELYARNADRKANYASLKPILDAAFLARDRADWIAFFEADGVPCGSVDTVEV